MGGVEALTATSWLPLDVRCTPFSNFEYEHIIVKSPEAGAMGYISKMRGGKKLLKQYKQCSMAIITTAKERLPG